MESADSKYRFIKKVAQISLDFSNGQRIGKFLVDFEKGEQCSGEELESVQVWSRANCYLTGDNKAQLGFK